MLWNRKLFVDLHEQIQNLADHSIWGVVLRSNYKDWTASFRIPTSQPVSNG